MSNLINDSDLGINLKSRLNRAILPWLKRLFAINKINALYEKCDKDNGAHFFIKSIIQELHININRRGENLENAIPKEGSLLVISNLAQGAIDALILLDTILQIRSDVKIVVPKFMGEIKPLNELFITDDNVCARKVIRHLDNGGVIVTFPSKEVTHPKVELLSTANTLWNSKIFKIAQLHSTPILPIAIYQTNGVKFFLSKRIAPAMAYTRALLEIINKRGSEQLILLGRRIESEFHSQNTSAEQVSEMTRISLALSYLEAAEPDEENSKEDVVNENTAKIIELTKSTKGRIVKQSSAYKILQFEHEKLRKILVATDAQNGEPLCAIEWGRLSEIKNERGEEGCDYYNRFEISRKFAPIREEILEVGELIQLSNSTNTAVQKHLLSTMMELFEAAEVKYLLTTATISNESSSRIKKILADYTLKNYIDRNNSKFIEPRIPIKHILSKVRAGLNRKIIDTRKYFLYFMHDTVSGNEIFTTDFKGKLRIANKIVSIGIDPKTTKLTALILIKKGDVPRGTL